MTPRRWTRREAMLALAASSLGLVLPAVSGCHRPRDPGPPEIRMGEDLCDWCRMTIDDPRLAAAFVPSTGRPLRFGEPGCLLSWLAEHRNAAGAPFVVTREDGGWLPAATARYARGLVRTPMAFDLTAWRGEPEGGTPLAWPGLLEEGAPRVTRG